MASPIIPWEPQAFPSEIVSELTRRENNMGLNFSKPGDWNNSSGEWSKYRGPMVPWIRVCSNGYGFENTDKIKPGFVFSNGKNFYESYGFGVSKNDPNLAVLGHTPFGVPHTLDYVGGSNYPIHVPPPTIEKISVTIQKELYRRATIEWSCYSPKQLEYMTPYFLIPNISVILEWGWNHFDPNSLIDLTDTRKLKCLFNNPYPLYSNNIIRSGGNYDVLFGIVTTFSWNIEGQKIRCKTEITSKDRIYAGLTTDAIIIDTTDRGNDSDNPLNSLKGFIPVLSEFKSVADSSDVFSIPPLGEFIVYLQQKRPNNWKDYLYGVFYGRNLESSLQYHNKTDDFDVTSTHKDLWLNMGLICEILNFHAMKLIGVGNESMFDIDLEGCVISAHPNLISTNGNILLIPNKDAPKYFYGIYGKNQIGISDQNASDYSTFQNCKRKVPLPAKKGKDRVEECKKNKTLPDLKLYKVHI